MKKCLMISGLALLCAFSGASAADRQGTVGLNYTVGPNFIAGSSDAQDFGVVEPGVGTALQVGVLPNIDFLFSYDYIHADLRTQAITFGGQYRLPMVWTNYQPFLGAGLGFGKPHSGEGWDHFSLKLTSGLEKALTDDVSMAGVLSYQFVDGTDAIGSVHAFEPGLRLIYYFGHLPK